ncbi:DNA-binding transcriptional regulator YhcF, GntR family [Lachnospiraceae bacterium C10]|nr:GntR family transcriptional regulator [Lachnospiraceae bacterium]SCW55062.1 DNA-binding transcriptional regulator YhcF, GntR family [Lachnospiraceae bacterium C10]SDW13515.1 DNA-binding transcriptional regulator YhcF, GntR family [Lachnospiraceae bacterium KHCPX20]
MSWNLSSDRPIFQQIIEHMELEIVQGVYKPGQKLPSVRELAMQATVNPNTMQRALSEMERMGLMHSERTSGRFITEDVGMIKELKKELAGSEITRFLEQMRRLGYSGEEMLEVLREELDKGEKK